MRNSRKGFFFPFLHYCSRELYFPPTWSCSLFSLLFYFLFLTFSWCMYQVNIFKEENRHIILFITLYIISTLYIRPDCVRYDSSASAEGTSALFTKFKRIKMRPRELKRYMKLVPKFRNLSLKVERSKGQNQTHGGAVAHRLAHVRLLCRLTARTLYLSFY